MTALVIERYDRDSRAPGLRLHQEDFNQALGYRGDEKYDSSDDGGRETLADIARLLRDHAGDQGVIGLLRLGVPSASVENLDLHAKNISVLHHPDGRVELAPMYDVVPQAHHDGLDQEYALRINGKVDSSTVTVEDLIAEGEKWKLRAVQRIVESTMNEVLDVVAKEAPLSGALFALREDIERQVTASRTPQLPSSAGHSDRSQSRRHGHGLGAAPGGWGGPAPTRCSSSEARNPRMSSSGSGKRSIPRSAVSSTAPRGVRFMINRVRGRSGGE